MSACLREKASEREREREDGRVEEKDTERGDKEIEGREVRVGERQGRSSTATYKLEGLLMILYYITLGIRSDVLTFMQAEIPSSKNHEKLTECFHFLRALACQNAPVQKR